MALIRRAAITSLAAAAIVALATTPSAQNAQPQAPAGYLTSGDLDGTALLGPPPAAGTARALADAARYAGTRSLAGTPRFALAARDDDLRAGTLQRFSCAVGITLSPGATPRTLRMLAAVERDVRTVGQPAKDHYGRRRPALDNDAPLCVPRAPWMEKNASYPSGHAMIGWSWALILAEIVPARANVILRSGKAYGDSRVICGVHYESDVEAGRLLAAAMVARLHAKAQFLGDEAAARTELRRAGRFGARPSGCADYD